MRLTVATIVVAAVVVSALAAVLATAAAAASIAIVVAVAAKAEGGDSNSNIKGSGDWKLIAPANSNTSVTVNGLEYHFCAHCVCKKTKHKGFSTGHTPRLTIGSPKWSRMTLLISQIVLSPVQEVLFLILNPPPALPCKEMLSLLRYFRQFQKKTLKMSGNEGGEEDSITVDPYPNRLDFLGAYMVYLNHDDAF